MGNSELLFESLLIHGICFHIDQRRYEVTMALTRLVGLYLLEELPDEADKKLEVSIVGELLELLLVGLL